MKSLNISRVDLTMSDLFINAITINWSDIPNPEEYPFNIPSISNLKNMEGLKFHKRVTFLTGENGTGKSTILEGLAIKCGLNKEGGSAHFNFSTYNSCSNLSDYLTVIKNGSVPKTKYFLRAESFYNVASTINDLKVNPYYQNKDFHACSHGESFIDLIKTRFYDHGLYILDEPEAALSPNRQMTLLCLINDLAQNGSQFIIATHSPILLSYRDGEILDMNNNFKKISYEETENYQTYKLFINNYQNIQEKLFN